MHETTARTRHLRSLDSPDSMHSATRWVLLALLFLSATVGAQTTPAAGGWSLNRPVYLFRSDGRHYDEIFRDGFRSRGTSDTNLEAFIVSASNSAIPFRFISLTDDENLRFFQNPMLDYYNNGGASQGPFVGYQYRIEAGNFEYSAISSLEHAAAAYPGFAAQLTATLRQYEHQREWVALDRVENHRIIDVQVLEHIPRSSPAQFRVLQTIPNPNYRPGTRAGGNPGPYIFQPGRITEPRLLANAPGARRFSPSFGQCFGSSRPKRSSEGSCERDFAQSDAQLNDYFNTETGKGENGLTPWKSNAHTRLYSVIEGVDFCTIDIQRGSYQIVIRCPTTNRHLYTPRKFDVLLSAGGRVRTYVDTRIPYDRLRRTNETNAVSYSIRAEDIPTVYSGFNFDFYTSKRTPLGTIFSGSTGNWWTGVRLRPHYPVQP
ncbi:hypothetical protein [Lysobacter sp. GCM10012299]|uniref:hypothetical protein n=1 Tax=Lysobacter sp. GCM10012299 TaxID=3317333 RepID=UPI003622543C